MARLRTTTNLERADDFYAALLQCHEGRNRAESEALNARLILILANHIGEFEVLEEALQMAARPDRDVDARDAQVPDGRSPGTGNREA